MAMIKKIAIILLVIIVIGLIGTIDTTYTRDVKVVDVDCVEIVVEDSQGYQWSFIGEGYEIDQEIQVVMNDNHSSTIFDDTIIKVK